MPIATFGPFRLDLESGELSRLGAAVRLQPQPARLLVLLVERAGGVVSREDIRQRLWGDDTFVDFDQNVNFCVRQVRRALHDNADTACYVETLPRCGYRFIAPVNLDVASAPAAIVGDVPDTAVAADMAAAAGRSRRGWLAAAVIGVAVIGVAAVSLVTGPGRATDVRAREQVAMGRFFLEKGSRADVLRALQHFEAAAAIDSSDAAAYAGLAEAYNQLGSVFVAGRPPADVRLLAIRAATRATTLDPGSAAGFAALGYTRLHELDWAGADLALRRAVTLDPRLVRAHQTYATYFAARGQPEAAVREARRAVELEPASLSARHTLAWMLYFNGRYDEAIRQLDAVLEMDDRYAPARLRLGQVLLVAGRLDEAATTLERAVRDTGRAPVALGLLAMALGARGQRADAEQLVEELERRAADETVPPGALLLGYLGIDDLARALTMLERSYVERDNYAFSIDVDPLMARLRGHAGFEVICRQVMLGADVPSDTLGAGRRRR